MLFGYFDFITKLCMAVADAIIFKQLHKGLQVASELDFDRLDSISGCIVRLIDACSGHRDLWLH